MFQIKEEKISKEKIAGLFLWFECYKNSMKFNVLTKIAQDYQN